MFAVSRLFFAAAGLSIAGLLATATGAEANQFKRVSNSNVSCDNRLVCDLFVTNPRASMTSVGFRRNTVPDAPVSLVLTTRDSLSNPSEIVISVDGAEIIRIDRSTLRYRAAVSEYMFADQMAVRRLLEAALPGRNLQVDYRTGSGRTTAGFSLAGIGEAAAFMDDVQGRTEREDAITRLSPVSPEGSAELEFRTVSAMLDIPYRIRSRWYLGPDTACREDALDRLGSEPGHATSSAGDGALYILPCPQTEAGDGAVSVWQEYRSDFRQVALPVIDGDAVSVVTIVADGVWDPETRELTGLSRSAEDGTCIWRTWRLSEDGADSGFTLIDQREKSDCSDSDPADDDDGWQQVWPLSR